MSDAGTEATLQRLESANVGETKQPRPAQERHRFKKKRGTLGGFFERSAERRTLVCHQSGIMSPLGLLKQPGELG